MIPLALLLACLEPSGNRIVAADLAQELPEFRALPPDKVLGYAPRPGAIRRFTPSELAQWLPPGSAALILRDTPLCMQWQLVRPDADAFRAAMRAALPEDSQMAVLETSELPVPKGQVHFPVAGLRPSPSGKGALWRGYVEYFPGGHFDVWARVDVSVPATRVVANENIRAGTVITEAMVRSEVTTSAPGQTGFASTVAEVAGRSARQLIPAKSPVKTAALDRRSDIRKGDTLRVRVLAGSAKIGLEATALASAVTGDMISVKVTETGRTIRARVAGPGEATVQLPGGN